RARGDGSALPTGRPVRPASRANGGRGPRPLSARMPFSRSWAAPTAVQRDSLGFQAFFFPRGQLSGRSLADYKRPPREQDSRRFSARSCNAQGAGKKLSPFGSGTLHERAPARLFPQQAAGVAGGHPSGGAGDVAASAGRKPKPSG